MFSCIERDSVVGTGRVEPDRIIGTGGGEQIGTVGEQLPFPLSVRVVSEKGKPVRNIEVKFSIINGSGILKDSVQLTDVDGNAKSYIIAGGISTEYLIHATVPGLKGSPVVFKLYVNTSSPTGIYILGGNNQNGTVGTKLQNLLTIFVGDQFSNPTPNTTVKFSIPSGKGSISPPLAISNENGIAFANWILDTLAGDQFAEAKILFGTKTTVMFTAHATSLLEPAITKIISGNNQIGVQGRVLSEPLVVSSYDRYGNLILGIKNNFNVLSGGGSLSGVQSFFGKSSTNWTLGNTSITQTVEVAYGIQTKLAFFNSTSYVQCLFDSLKYENGKVTMYWQKNQNSGFVDYTIFRSPSETFSTQTQVGIFTDENILTGTDSTPPSGWQYYRIRMRFSNNFSFYSDASTIQIP